MRCWMGSVLIASSASLICGCEVEMPESTSTLPCGPGSTAMLPPEPISTLTLPRSFWTVIFALVAFARALRTISGCCGGSCWAKSERGAKYPAAATEAVERKLRRVRVMGSLSVDLGNLACRVVDDDLPAFVGLLEDKREDAVRVAALFLASFQMVAADYD